MYKPDAYLRIAGVQVFGKVLCAINATVLATRASEREHQTCKPAANVAFYMVLRQQIDMAEESENLAVILKEFYHWLV